MLCCCCSSPAQRLETVQTRGACSHLNSSCAHVHAPRGWPPLASRTLPRGASATTIQCRAVLAARIWINLGARLRRPAPPTRRHQERPEQSQAGSEVSARHAPLALPLTRSLARYRLALKVSWDFAASGRATVSYDNKEVGEKGGKTRAFEWKDFGFKMAASWRLPLAREQHFRRHCLLLVRRRTPSQLGGAREKC